MSAVDAKFIRLRVVEELPGAWLMQDKQAYLASMVRGRRAHEDALIALEICREGKDANGFEVMVRCDAIHAVHRVRYEGSEFVFVNVADGVRATSYLVPAEDVAAIEAWGGAAASSSGDTEAVAR